MPQLVLDPYSYYDYKLAFERQKSEGSKLVMSWVGDDNKRRLNAYMLLESYCKNTARTWLDPLVKDDSRRDRREYGDPHLIVETGLASLIGSDMSIVVPKAAGQNAPAGAAEYQTAQREWAEGELFEQKVIDCERKAVKLGDSVYVLTWDREAQKTRLTVYDPGFYFPVLDNRSLVTAYPDKIHIAWEFVTGEGTNDEKRWLKRCTWELREPDVANGEQALAALPWNPKPKVTCFYSEKVWSFDNMEGDVFNLKESAGTSELEDENGESVDELDLVIDFIPVVHVPNTVAGEEHYGVSLLAQAMQAFDDLTMTDTDLQSASRLTGSPPLIVGTASAVPRDENGNISTVGPGAVYETADGNANFLDTSRNLDALLKYDEHLLERVSVNTRTPEALMGRVKPNEVPSGIALTLGFTPHSHMVREMRIVRKQKYGLLFKFNARMHVLNLDDATAKGLWQPMLPTDMKFGSFLPADKQEVSTIIAQLYRAEAPMISLETAVTMALDAGFPIESVLEEVDRITKNDFVKASQVLDATGDINEARKRVGLGPLDLGGAGGFPVPPGPTPPPKPPTPPA